MSTHQDDDVTKLFNNVYGFVFFQALVSACELGLFGYLEEHPGSTLDDVAAGLKLPATSTRALLLGCAYLDYLSRDGEGRYANKPIASRFLVPTSKESVLALVRSNNRVQYKAMFHMPEALRAGTNVGLDAEYKGTGRTLYERLAFVPELENVFHDAMENFTHQTIELLAKAPELASVRVLLDVGGGTGETSMALCDAHPGLRAVIMDRATVTSRAKEEIAKRGMTGRVDTHVGEMFADAFPAGIDAILFAHLIEIYSEEQVKALLKKAFDALPKGGRTIIWSTVANDEETGNAFAAKISLYFMTLASGCGYTYPAKDYERWMKEIGYASVSSRTGLPWEHGLIVGEK